MHQNSRRPHPFNAGIAMKWLGSHREASDKALGFMREMSVLSNPLQAIMNQMPWVVPDSKIWNVRMHGIEVAHVVVVCCSIRPAYVWRMGNQHILLCQYRTCPIPAYDAPRLGSRDGSSATRFASPAALASLIDIEDKNQGR